MNTKLLRDVKENRMVVHIWGEHGYSYYARHFNGKPFSCSDPTMSKLCKYISEQQFIDAWIAAKPMPPDYKQNKYELEAGA